MISHEIRHSGYISTWLNNFLCLHLSLWRMPHASRIGRSASFWNNNSNNNNNFTSWIHSPIFSSEFEVCLTSERFSVSQQRICAPWMLYTTEPLRSTKKTESSPPNLLCTVPGGEDIEYRGKICVVSDENRKTRQWSASRPTKQAL